ncbi:MAG: hypothetical protein N3C12_11395 [Candidatus Binatia bacterium]|nr:hypothetical protein [Candidatus Binatia bacterium]
MPDYRRRATKEAMSVRFDFHGVLAGEPKNDAGVVSEIENLAGELARVHARVSSRRQAGELPFLDWIHTRGELSAVKELADTVRRNAKTLVVVGSGGTALAAQALVGAVRPASFRVVVADTIDPDYFGALVEELDLTTTVFNVISKSGETAETLAQFLVIRDLLLRHLGAVDYTRHLVVTTDADQGALRQIVHDEGFQALAIPAGVSDRFAALSPASLFPAAVAGLKPDDVLAGASWMELRCQEESVWRNPALLLAACLYVAHRRLRLAHLFFLPFCRQLEALAHWSAELFVEALQKSPRAPSTPGLSWLPNSWRTADPSLLAELLLERPHDTVAIFLTATDHGRELAVAAAYQDLDALAYLGGKGAGQILQESARALEALLRRSGRWHVATRWPQVNAFTLGQWIYALELVVVYLAELLGVDLWLQPASEAYRRLLSAQLGRKGLEAQGEEAARLLASQREEWIL